MKDVRLARMIMQLRQGGVTDTRVLAALEATPREMFLGTEHLAQAYEDHALPIGCGQTISQPLVVGMMTQALSVDDGCKVLEVGTGSGYQAAVVARLCRRIYSLERHRDLHLTAEQRFARLHLHNVATRFGDGWKGWPEQAPFHRIIVTAAAAELPEDLSAQLAPGGVMTIPIGPQFGAQTLWRIVKDAQTGHMIKHKLFPVRFVPMVRGLANSARG